MRPLATWLAAAVLATASPIALADDSTEDPSSPDITINAIPEWPETPLIPNPGVQAERDVCLRPDFAQILADNPGPADRLRRFCAQTARARLRLEQTLQQSQREQEAAAAQIETFRRAALTALADEYYSGRVSAAFLFPRRDAVEDRAVASYTEVLTYYKDQEEALQTRWNVNTNRRFSNAFAGELTLKVRSADAMPPAPPAP